MIYVPALKPGRAQVPVELHAAASGASRTLQAFGPSRATVKHAFSERMRGVLGGGGQQGGGVSCAGACFLSVCPEGLAQRQLHPLRHVLMLGPQLCQQDPEAVPSRPLMADLQP